MEPVLTERSARLLAASEARVLGHGGVALVARATGLSRPTIYAGLEELVSGSAADLEADRIRHAGAGRKEISVVQPRIKAALDALVEPIRGDPMTPLRWTCKSLRRLAEELQRKGFRIGPSKVGQLLHEEGYGLQGNRKSREGEDHPDRDAQFKHISRQVLKFQSRGEPVVGRDSPVARATTLRRRRMGSVTVGSREVPGLWRLAQVTDQAF